MKKTSIIKNCTVCQKAFEAHKYSIKNGHALFCSLSCKGVASRGMKKDGSYRNCLTCQKEFYAKPFQIKIGRAKYCSRECGKDATNKKISESNSGKVRTPEMRKAVSEAKIRSPLTLRGVMNPAWRGGVTSENSKIRHSIEYRLWREAVFARDNWTCKTCLIRGGILNADHIKPFALFPELRFAIDNGRTLCVPCHKQTPTWGNKIKSAESFMEIYGN